MSKNRLEAGDLRLECDQSIDTWHVCITGFTQREGIRSGLMKLWLKLMRLYGSPRSVVTVREWNANWAGVAEAIFQARNGVPSKIIVYAYSYGAGWGFVRLARELQHRGLQVKCAVLCDPVRRIPIPGLRWLALTRWLKIVIPDNVSEVRWCYQRTNRPSAHPLVAADERVTKIRPGLELHGVTHQYADDHQAFHHECLNAAGEHA